MAIDQNTPAQQTNPHHKLFNPCSSFQCYDRRALASLAAAAAAAGRPEWGYGGPHDAPRYNDAPSDAGFTAPYGGSWASDYGRFFAEWYAGQLVAHAERLAGVAVAVFGPGDGAAAPTAGTPPRAPSLPAIPATPPDGSRPCRLTSPVPPMAVAGTTLSTPMAAAIAVRRGMGREGSHGTGARVRARAAATSPLQGPGPAA